MVIYALDINYNTSAPKTEKHNGSFVYLHGKLEDKNGFDLVEYIDPLPCEDGEYDAEVQFANRERLSCRLYFWHANGMQKGLVVLPDDEEAAIYAEKCLKDKAEFL